MQDAPVIIDGGGPYEVEEDTYLPLSIKLKIRTMIMRRTRISRARCACRRRSGALRIVGGKAVAAASGSLLEDGEGIILKGTPSSITSTLTKLEYASAPIGTATILSISWRTTAGLPLVAIR